MEWMTFHKAKLIFLLQKNRALPSYGRHFSLSCGLPTYPGAQLMTAKTQSVERNMNQLLHMQHEDKVLDHLTVHSTGRCSRADRPCTGSLHFQGSHRWERTCHTDQMLNTESSNTSIQTFAEEAAMMVDVQYLVHVGGIIMEIMENETKLQNLQDKGIWCE